MRTPASITEWLDQWIDSQVLFYLKRLSANDTLATGAHQAGPYIPKDLLFRVFPGLYAPGELNPRIRVRMQIDSHAQSREATVIWYNNKLHGKTRDEARVTNLGGRSSILLDPDSTGALAIFAFLPGAPQDGPRIRVWVARSPEEEEEAELRFGPVEPGQTVIWPSLAAPCRPRPDCFLERNAIPTAWLEHFPTGEEILEKALELNPAVDEPVDTRLLKRRECEYELFRSVEEALELPVIRQGFNSLDDFLERAQTILQRRKARSGRSLELQVKRILVEEGLREGMDFVHGAESDPGSKKTPDFLFPCREAYRDPSFPAERLRMLAVKTTCKDRWRQILNEADRIRVKHLLTLQEGVSEAQFREMKQAGVQLVVPAQLQVKYPRDVRAGLVSLASFIAELKTLSRT